ncbi:MAG: hypothetical protein ACTSUE_01355 [Promethearchaeota archaeon]
MATIRFDRQDELDELIARIYLDTNRKFTKKELLELIFEIGIKDYTLLLKKIQQPELNGDEELRTQFIKTLSGVLLLSDSDADDVEPKKIWEKEVV